MTTATLEPEPKTIETKKYEGELCDADGARASWLVYLEKSELAWCNHHYTRFLAKFADKRVINLID